MLGYSHIYTVDLTLCLDVEVKHEDFLNLDPTDPSYSRVILFSVAIVLFIVLQTPKSIYLQLTITVLQVRAILLDPSCSGSGTAIDRLDHLLPSHNAGEFQLLWLNKCHF